MMTIIGRIYEKKKLSTIFQSDKAEFVAVYGRRRVGKTHLIREFFQKKNCIFFRSSGVHKGALTLQLHHFKQEIERTFYARRMGINLAEFNNWHDAFSALKDAIEIFAGKNRVVIFLDEVPWMATPRSGLLEALDYYWNRFWSEDKRIKLIVCGSAASWIIENILHNTGGLYNRVTARLPIAQFSLAETADYLKYRNINYDHQQVLMLYMCMGGIPYYLDFVEKGLSAVQNINNMCFSRKGTLYDEFELLFASLFNRHALHEEMIRFIARKRSGVTRKEIEAHFDCKGGRLSGRLQELEEAGFIISFTPGNRQRGLSYKVIDEYTLFYLTFIAPRATNGLARNVDERYWEALSLQPVWKAWAGLAFESICFKHINQIRKALQIPDGSNALSWRSQAIDGETGGTQIDLIFDRPDNIINLCEIKYCSTPYVVDKKYVQKSLERAEIYRKMTKSHKHIFHSLIASGGIKKNSHSEELIASSATLHDLFHDSL